MDRRPVVYDISRLITRVFDRTPNGIDRVDFALANHFVDPNVPLRSGMMLTAFGPRVVTPRSAREALDNIRKHWGEDEFGGHGRRFSRGRRGDRRGVAG